MSIVHKLAVNNAQYRRTSGEFVFTETEFNKFIIQLRDRLTDDVLGWYNASKKAEDPSDPYWKGYQHAIDDVVESIFDTTLVIE